MQKIVFLAVLVAALAVGSQGASPPTKYPGLPCTTANGPTVCDTTSTGLECTEPAKGCQCVGNHKFYFGTNDEKCVLPSGVACTGAAGESLTPNSECATNVRCLPNFIENPAKRCIRARTVACVSANNECDEDKFQICLPAVGGAPRSCGCNTDSELDSQRVCKLKAEKPCQVSGPSPSVPPQACHVGSKCDGTKCTCNAPSTDVGNGLCRVKHDAPCSAELICDESELYSECKTKCMCKGQGISTLWENGKCVLAPDAPCFGTDPTDIQCGGGSSCDVSNFYCTCPPGTGRGANLKCTILHGEDCRTDADDCDASGDLVCKANAEGAVEGKCVCKNNFIFEKGVCKVKADAPCIPNKQCVDHAACPPTGDNPKCTCGQDLSNLNGQCVGEIGASCGTGIQAPCNSEKFLSCIAGKCGCGANAWLNGNVCELLHGSPCKIGDAKAQSCSKKGSIGCVANAGSTTDGTCQCQAPAGVDQGLVASADKTQCFASADKACGGPGHALCNADKFLECNAGKCSCAANAWYNPESQNCELLINEACEAFGGSLPCTHNSTCIANKCMCESGLVASKDRRSCIESIGAPCTSDSNCNTDKYLLCIEGKCDCDQKSWFNPKSTSCELLAGQPCLNVPGSQSCTDFSICEGNRGDTMCNCLDGYVESFDGKCVATFGGSCGAENDAECNPDEFLTCDGGKCSCDSESWFNPHTAECQLLAGRSCSVGPRDQQCTDYSKCMDIGSGKQVCVCDDEYVSNNMGKCAKQYGAPCIGSDTECTDFLVCTNTKCSCYYDSWYNNDTLRCELFAGEYCIPGSGNQPCTEFAACNRGGSGGGYACNCQEGFRLSTDKRCVHKTCGYESMQGMFQKPNQQWNYPYSNA